MIPENPFEQLVVFLIAAVLQARRTRFASAFLRVQPHGSSGYAAVVGAGAHDRVEYTEEHVARFAATYPELIPKPAPNPK